MTQLGGRVNGGSSRDSLNKLQGGRVNGGSSPESLNKPSGGRVNGGSSRDSLNKPSGGWINGGITMPLISVSVNFLLLALLSLTACYCSLYSCHGDGSLVSVPTQMRKPGFLVVLDRARYSREKRKNHREV
ncbi:hypothetical protein T11_15028 [Trichinella zimbabwensis]|uniref:Uncharacterized protein n=1 Tax=Trichinella zimbabwensis TaxID=268475 RepID=A0A0V1HF86_9BILA|nr:hypothetical protein T11_15028 [Trichinella zimbabwensis]